MLSRRVARLRDDLARPVGSERALPEQPESLPAVARRCLAHVVRPGAAPAPTVRLRMAGPLRLGGKWLPFVRSFRP
jgi:hypothetical protein